MQMLSRLLALEAEVAQLREGDSHGKSVQHLKGLVPTRAARSNACIKHAVGI